MTSLIVTYWNCFNVNLNRSDCLMINRDKFIYILQSRNQFGILLEFFMSEQTQVVTLTKQLILIESFTSWLSSFRILHIYFKLVVVWPFYSVDLCVPLISKNCTNHSLFSERGWYKLYLRLWTLVSLFERLISNLWAELRG